MVVCILVCVQVCVYVCEINRFCVFVCTKTKLHYSHGSCVKSESQNLQLHSNHQLQTCPHHMTGGGPIVGALNMHSHNSTFFTLHEHDNLLIHLSFIKLLTCMKNHESIVNLSVCPARRQSAASVLALAFSGRLLNQL